RGCSVPSTKAQRRRFSNARLSGRCEVVELGPQPLDLGGVRLDLRGGSAAEIQECTNVDEAGELQAQVVTPAFEHVGRHAAASSSTASGERSPAIAGVDSSMTAETTAPAAARAAST